MADWLKDEALYDQERLEQRIAGLRTERGLSRREAVQLLAMSVCGAAVALSGSAAAPLRALAQTADPADRKADATRAVSHARHQP